MDNYIKQDFDAIPSTPVQATKELLEQSVPPEEYERQISSLTEKEAKSGFQEERLDNCSNVYVFGDIHARTDQLATALESIENASEKRNSSLEEELRTGKTVLLFAGDLVHSEKNVGNYWQATNPVERRKIAEENLNTVIGLFNLKRNYPKSVLIVQGNHDLGATIPGSVAKNGTDQGEMLNNVLLPHHLSEPLQNLLNQLPLMSVLNIQNRKIILSHALPLPAGGYAEAIRLLDAQRLPFGGDQMNSDYIKGSWGNSREEAIKNIADRKDSLVKLLTWSKLQSPSAGIFNALSLGEKTRLPEDVLNQKSKEFIQDYVYLLTKFLFSSDSLGKLTKPSDILWLVGHESITSMRDIVKSMESPRLKSKGVKIFQINDYSQIPVLGMSINKWYSDSFISDNGLKSF